MQILEREAALFLCIEAKIHKIKKKCEFQDLMAKLLDFSLSHCCIIISLSCGFFVAIKLYNKASGCSIPFGKEHPLFLGYLNETAPFAED